MQIIPIKTGSDGNIYIIKTINNNNYLLECGIKKEDTVKCLYFNHKLSISDFKGCFISHIHSDHCESAKWVNTYMPIYSNRQVIEKGYKGSVLLQNKTKKFEDFSVVAFNVEHGDVENYGYVFADKEEKILFVTDFSTFDPNISNIEFTQLFIECNWTDDLMQQYLKEYEGKSAYTKYERQYNTHCGISVLKELLEELNLSKCEKITLIHPSKECCDKELALEEIRNMFPNIDIDFAVNERW